MPRAERKNSRQGEQDAQKVRLFCPSFVKRRSSLVADSDAEFLRDTLHEGRFTVFALADFFRILLENLERVLDQSQLILGALR